MNRSARQILYLELPPNMTAIDIDGDLGAAGTIANTVIWATNPSE